MKLKCIKCKHSWLYKGKSNYYATCPRCLNKVRVKDSKEKNKVKLFKQI